MRKCNNCFEPMRLDDRDYLSKWRGDYTNYWVCDNCGYCANEIVRDFETVDFIDDFDE